MKADKVIKYLTISAITILITTLSCISLARTWHLYSSAAIATAPNSVKALMQEFNLELTLYCKSSYCSKVNVNNKQNALINKIIKSEREYLKKSNPNEKLPLPKKANQAANKQNMKRVRY